MSWRPAEEPHTLPGTADAAVQLAIQPRRRDIGGFAVGRLLPAVARRMVGPFIFLDHMGPVEQPAGQGMDVPPHPHIGLATVTYLLQGEGLHRDSLGSAQPIRPGDVNWMTAGRGIVHSERTPEAARSRPHRFHDVQAWVALPEAAETGPPAFDHHPAASLPLVEEDGAVLRVLAGEAFGRRAPVAVASPLFYVDAALEAGASLTLPPAYSERAAFLIEGTVRAGGPPAGDAGSQGPVLLVFTPGGTVRLTAETPARLLLLGGEPLEGPRYIWWNFVAGDPARIERAKEDWRSGRFPPVPGDEGLSVPLPDIPGRPARAGG